MKKKIISFMLSLVLLSTVVTPSTVAYATADDKGMVTSKTATAKGDGSYTITLEAYATGEQIISEVTEDVPTDIILVLDQSGSMDDAFDTITSGSYSERDNSNMENYPYRQNGGSDNIWYQLSDGSFVRVSMRIKQNTEDVSWTPCARRLPISGEEYVRNSELVDWSDQGVLYQRLDDGTYARCYVTRVLDGYTYTYADGTTEHVGYLGNPTQVAANRFYYASSNVTNTYEYFYVDANGNEVAIETSTGDNTKPTETYYSLTTTSTDRTKLQALKDAVSQFSDSVAKKAAATDVNHRIAVVGFASGNTWNGRNYNYNNTEVFVGANQYTYGSAAQGVYSTAFMDMNDSGDVANVTASIGALAADGGTLTNLGVEMANGIFKANPIPAGQKRNRVVIVFTDGQPGWSGYDSNTASAAITQAATTKSTYGATVYTVGIFEGANVNGNDNTNTFMRSLSSGTGYYLTASDSAALSNIFQQISNNIQTGGSSTTLDAKAVIRDIIAPQFELPANATTESIKLYTAESNGSVNSWKPRETFAGSVSLGTNDNSVSVSGFSFKDNWCGNQTINGQELFHDGKKLIIEFTVQPKAGFLGGNDVYTNTGAGVYADATATDPVKTFPQPQVNVPIKDVTVTATDKNVYLKGEVTADQLKDGATVKVGDVALSLAPDALNYGLEAWQTEYVEITVTVKDKDGNPISDKLDNLTDDTTYTVEVTVEPKTVGTSSPEKGDAATAKTGVNAPAAKINVFKPELTFKDSTAYYGESVPANNNYSGNKDGSETWKHGDTVSTDVTMLGTKPTLDISYTPDASKLEGGKYTKQDVPVAATVKIGTENINEHTTFVHQDCGTACDWETPATPGAPAFLIHIQTCTLTITKAGGASDEPYVFTVYKDNTKYSEVTVMGGSSKTIYELPVGSYTIQEDTDWSWRYTPEYSNAVALSKDVTSGTITCSNTQANSFWLNGFSNVMQNIFGVNH